MARPGSVMHLAVPRFPAEGEASAIVDHPDPERG
jgi:hypothetical protein